MQIQMMKVTKSDSFRFFQLKIIHIILIILAFFIQAKVRSFSYDSSLFVEDPESYLGLNIDHRIVRRLLGVNIAVSDLVWIDTVIKSDLVREKKDFTNLFKAFRTVVRLDPDHFYAYYSAGLYLSVIKDDIKGATLILTDGAERLKAGGTRWSGEWALYFTLGYNLLFEEHNVEAAAPWIRLAADQPTAPHHVKKIAERLKTKAGQLEVAARVLNEFYRRIDNPDQKKVIEDKMLLVSADQELVHLNENFELYKNSSGAKALSKKRQFDQFMRSIGHSEKDLAGRKLEISEAGVIEAH